MTIDGKENVKERIKIYSGKYFTTYRYIFENGNSYIESKEKWRQRDFTKSITKTPEDLIENQLDKLQYRR